MTKPTKEIPISQTSAEFIQNMTEEERKELTKTIDHLTTILTNKRKKEQPAPTPIPQIVSHELLTAMNRMAPIKGKSNIICEFWDDDTEDAKEYGTLKTIKPLKELEEEYKARKNEWPNETFDHYPFGLSSNAHYQHCQPVVGLTQARTTYEPDDRPPKESIISFEQRNGKIIGAATADLVHWSKSDLLSPDNEVINWTFIRWENKD